MKLLASIAIGLIASAAFTLAPPATHAALQVVEQDTDEGHLNVYKMTVTAADEPTPALKYRLTLSEIELKPGNAAVHYLRAFPEGGFDATLKAAVKQYGSDTFYSWINFETPLEKLPLEKVREATARFDSYVDNYIRPASQRQDCDWGHSIVKELKGPALYNFLLPEIQSMRSMSRILVLRARVALADRRYDDALDLLRMNYRLGVNVARSPFLVSGLVGIAVCGMSNAGVIELISAPDSPNLYWALAELQRPLVDMKPAMQLEMGWVYRIFPVLLDAETEEHSPQEWARLWAKSAAESLPMATNMPPINEFEARLGITGLSLIQYPQAKQRLIASGLDASRVQKMPVGQVIAIDAARQFRQAANNVEKWWYLPYSLVRERARQAERFTGSKLTMGFGQMLANFLLPAVNSARSAETRLQWQLGAIQTVEAIRMHASKTGKLPAALKDVDVVPVPDNPATNQPYQYRLDGETAILELPFSDGFPGIAWRFEIKLAK